MDKINAQRAQEVQEKISFEEFLLEKGEPHFSGCKRPETILALGTVSSPKIPAGDIARDGAPGSARAVSGD